MESSNENETSSIRPMNHRSNVSSPAKRLSNGQDYSGTPGNSRFALSFKNFARLIPAVLIQFLLIGSLGSLTLSGCASGNGGQGSAAPAQARGEIPAMPVKIARALASDVAETSSYLAALKSRKSVSLRPQVEGRILEILITSGDRVPAGAKLMVLDRSKQEALVSSTEAAIQSARADFENAHATLVSLKASRLSSVANFQFADKQLGRYQKLNEDGAVSSESVDEIRNRMAVSSAELEAIDARIQAQKAQVTKAEKLIEQAEATRKEQIEQLRYFTVTAPIAGHVGDVPVRVGDYVTTDSNLTTIDQVKPLELYVHVPTSQSFKLKTGLSIDVLDDEGETVESARLFFVSSQVDANQQSVLAKALLTNESEILRTGQNVKCRIIWDHVQAVTIPVTAVTRFSGQDFIFVAEPDGKGKFHASQRAVKLGSIIGNHYRVISGVHAGESIVSSGIQNLTDGMPIAPAPAT